MALFDEARPQFGQYVVGAQRLQIAEDGHALDHQILPKHREDADDFAPVLDQENLQFPVGAAHAAEGYARSTGKAGVVLVTSGPGATNLVTGIMAANNTMMGQSIC